MYDEIGVYSVMKPRMHVRLPIQYSKMARTEILGCSAKSSEHVEDQQCVRVLIVLCGEVDSQPFRAAQRPTVNKL